MRLAKPKKAGFPKYGLGILTEKTGCWIQYQLKLSGLGQKAVADEANCSVDIISHFLCGHKNSERVRTALCKVLGCQSFENLIKNVPKKGHCQFPGL
jgi:hypothetical protein